MLTFTQYRDTASHLVEELNTIPGVKADRFVGQASKTLDKGLTQDEQAARALVGCVGKSCWLKVGFRLAGRTSVFHARARNSCPFRWR